MKRMVRICAVLLASVSPLCLAVEALLVGTSGYGEPDNPNLGASLSKHQFVAQPFTISNRYALTSVLVTFVDNPGSAFNATFQIVSPIGPGATSQNVLFTSAITIPSGLTHTNVSVATPVVIGPGTYYILLSATQDLPAQTRWAYGTTVAPDSAGHVGGGLYSLSQNAEFPAASPFACVGGTGECIRPRFAFRVMARAVAIEPSFEIRCLGESVTFNSRVSGPEPFTYQWYFNATNVLQGQTNGQLVLTNLQTNHSGAYSVIASNELGAAASPQATLRVDDPCVAIQAYAGVTVTGQVGRAYTIEYVTNIAATNWTTIATNTLNQPTWLFIDSNTPIYEKRYFRARAQP